RRDLPWLRHASRKKEDEAAWERSIVSLRDRSVKDHVGDLGWTVEYATAWLYRNLINNQTEVADALDWVRENDEQGVDRSTPFFIFDHLNRVLFGGKLRGMVHLKWKSLASSSPGVTSAAGVLP
ncbi:hypothetical protein LTR53_019818, partial [Teratosphaeriaceae sp. CCFEE 6253]